MPTPESSTPVVSFIKLCETLQQDLRSLSSETRRKYPQIKESSDACVKRLRDIANSPNTKQSFLENNIELIRPFLLGCNTKIPKVVLISLSGIQKMIINQALTEDTAASLVTTLWNLMEAGIEELKLLQTAILLITTNSVVKDQQLAKALVLCFRLHFTKNSATINTAAATIRQCTHAVFERVQLQYSSTSSSNGKSSSGEILGIASSHDGDAHHNDNNSSTVALDSYVERPAIDLAGSNDEMARNSNSVNLSTLSIPARDAYLLFRDICLLVNGEPPLWLHGMTEMTRSLGMEIIESVLADYPLLFRENAFFIGLLKDRVCPLVIKLFSSTVKFKPTLMGSSVGGEKPSFSLVCRLIRLIAVIITHFFYLLNTECEIFLSCLLKFLENDKPPWQRALALEVLFKFSSNPSLLKHICECYDMKEQPTKIYRDIVSALSGYIQSAFHGTLESTGHNSGNNKEGASTQGIAPAIVAGQACGPGVSPKSAFVSRNVSFPVHLNPKIFLMDMMDKTEPPTPPEGYNVSIAFLALLEIVRSVQRIVDRHEADLQHGSPELELELISSSWCGVLAAFSTLLDSSCDESATEAILRANQNMVSLCGGLGIIAPRDAFVTALCKAALPQNYATTLLSLAVPSDGNRPDTGTTTTTSSEQNIDRNQVAVVGSSCLVIAGLSSSSQLGPMILTTKNLQCMRAILSLTHCHGAVLGQSWYLVLTTLQHLVCILGLKINATSVTLPGGSSSSANSSSTLSSNTNATSTTSSSNTSSTSTSTAPVANTALLADLPVLTTMLSRLFESSKYLDDTALGCLVDALVRLSQEAIEVTRINKDPSLFPVAKLTETGHVNMSRMQYWWPKVTTHLLDVCRVNHMELRPLGAISLVNLVKSAMEYRFEPPFWENDIIHNLVLEPFSHMSDVAFDDVRRKQFETVQMIVHSYGQVIGPCWNILLKIIGSIDVGLSEQLVRNAFQCLQLVISDYISSMQCDCYIQLVHVVTKFAKQKQDLNISLTAIGSLWHISDYFYQQWEEQQLRVHMAALATTVLHHVDGGVATAAADREPLSMDQELWISIFQQLGQLCIDTRPAVRKSAGQTLFNTIESHGGLLKLNSWQVVLWKVLFPLLQFVEEYSANAPEERDIEEQGNLLMHHSRDTVAKQWAETRVLTLSGVAQLFAGPRGIALMQLNDYARAWKLMLDYIEHSALYPNAEVALHSLKSLQELYQLPSTKEKLFELYSTTIGGAGIAVLNNVNDLIVDYDSLWWMAWETWSCIGTKATLVQTLPESQIKPSQQQQIKNNMKLTSAHSRAPSTASQTATLLTNNTMPSAAATLQKPPMPLIFVPTQTFLTLHMDLSCDVMERILIRLTEENLEQYFLALRQSLLIPVSASAAPFLLPTNYQESQLTALQESSLKSIKWVMKSATQEEIETEESKQSTNLHVLLPTIFLHVTDFVQFAIQLPKSNQQLAQYQREFNAPMSFVSFGEQCLKMVTELYQSCADEQQIIDTRIMEEIIKVIHLPLSLKYNCPSQSTWKLAVHCLTAVMCVGIPVARKQKEEMRSMWTTLADTLHDFLFSNVKCPSTLSMEEFKEHEKIDCQFIHLIREQFLSNSTGVPDFFIECMIGLLNKGSIHSTTSSCLSDTIVSAVDESTNAWEQGDLEHGRAFRENFAELCFETLLKYSFRESNESQQSADTVNKAAVRAILQRCKSVLVRYVEDDRLSGNCPLPRARLSEVAFVLKAMRTLLQTFKQTPKSKIDSGTWMQVIDIYPHAVDCVMVASGQFMKPLRMVLHEYKDLMQPWASSSSSSSAQPNNNN